MPYSNMHKPSRQSRGIDSLKLRLISVLDELADCAYGGRVSMWHPLAIHHQKRIMNVADIYRWNALGLLSDKSVEQFWLKHSIDDFRISLAFTLRLSARRKPVRSQFKDLQSWCQNVKEPLSGPDVMLN